MKASDFKCVVDKCDRRGLSKGLCKTHYERQRLGRSITEPIRRKNKPGIGCVHPNGYHYKQENNRVFAVHREVMSAHIGRPLLPCETVHHINGVRNDNRLENLELWSTSQPYGQRVEDKLKWANELISRYAQPVKRPYWWEEGSLSV